MEIITTCTRHSLIVSIKRVGQLNFSNIGFVGLGNMGALMSKNLIKKGYKLTVYDIDKKAIENVVNAGAKSAKNITEVSKNSEAIITMLPMDRHVLDCYIGNDGIISTARKGTFLVDSSTIDPSTSQSIAKEAEKHELKFVDGPVSGGTIGAKNGTLTFMVGGSKSNYEQIKLLLEGMGSRAIHCGNVGMGQVAKICNNMLLAISMIGVSEALSLGDKLGLDPKILTDIINTSTGRCWSSEIYNPVPGMLPNIPSSNDYEGGFGTELIVKDLSLAQTVAMKTGSPIALGSLCLQIYRAMIVHGLGNKDFSIIYQFIRGQIKS